MLQGCSEGFGPGKDQSADQTELSVYHRALTKGDIGLAYESRLKYFAKAVAQSLTSPGVGTYLKNEIGKKFDGDYDVLWATVKDRDFPNLGRMRGLVASSLQGMNSIVSIQEIEEVPLLQISLPVGFEAWDGETAIKVAYTPLTINDVDVTEIYAYDGSGEEYILDGQEPPDFPLIVVGINERIAYNQSLKKTIIDDGEGGGGGVGGGGTTELYPYITEIDPTSHPNNWEPYYAGDAELYWAVRIYEHSGGVKIDVKQGNWAYDAWVFTITGWHSSTPWRSANQKLGNAPESTSDIYDIAIWEYDPLFQDGPTQDPSWGWDCNSQYEFVAWLIDPLCDFWQNVFQFSGNDDFVGSVSGLGTLTTIEEIYTGTGVKLKVKYKSYQE